MSSSRSTSRADSFRHAFAGVAYALSTQPNTRIHAAIMVGTAGLGAWLRIPAGGWALIALAAGAVWTAELVNTALEAVVDLASPDHHPLAKAAKDTAAAAVLLAAVTAVIVGLLVLGPPLFERLRPLLAP
ncbi:MAG: diacylglycerol kinase [Anaerolineae bacterium]